MCFIYGIIYSYIKENMMCQNSNGMFNNRIKFKFSYKIYIKIMRCKIVRFQKLMWRNMMRSTKSKKFSVLHYSKYRFLSGKTNKNKNWHTFWYIELQAWFIPSILSSMNESANHSGYEKPFSTTRIKSRAETETKTITVQTETPMTISEEK